MLWLGFAPVQLGGPVSYVIISGNSMEPDIQVGDLVLARKQTSYQEDQRVVYNHPQVGFVFHRIIDQTKGRFILKGDNNDWLDSYQPSEKEILGKYWFMIPGAGTLIRALRQPIYFVSFVLITAFIIGSMFFFPEVGEEKKKKGKQRMKKTQNTGSASDNRLDLILSLGLIAIAALVLAVVAYSRPLTFSVMEDVFYEHRHDFSYTASDEGQIYDRSGVETGDPIYPLLTCQMNLVYSYHLTSDWLTKAEEKALDGSIKLTASLSDADGWNRSYLLIPEYHFTGAAITAPSSVNICSLLRTIADKEEKTGAEIRTYQLTIRPEIEISGEINGIPVAENQVPEFRFILDENVLRVAESDTGFSFEQEGALSQAREVPQRMVFFGKGIKVETLRWVSMIVLGLCLLGAAYPAWSFYGDWKASAASRIKVQNQPLLVEIKTGSLKKKGMTVIDLASFVDLRKLAERYGAMIMHEISGDQHTYTVQDGTTLYQVSITAEKAADLPEEAEG